MSSVSLSSSPVAADDLLQDAGSWLQIVVEGSLKRVHPSLGWTFNKNFRAEVGYLNQYREDATHTDNSMHHLIMGSLFINF